MFEIMSYTENSDIEKEITCDSFFNGLLKIKQYKNGYRFSIDSVILATETKLEKNDKYIMDLGCGCGVISLICAFLYDNIKIWGVEIQNDLAKIANINVIQNNFQNQITILNQDFKELKANQMGKLFDIVICNPPFYKKNSGRINPDNEKAIARHEIYANLDDIIKVARRMLRNFGRLIIIYPSTNLVDLFIKMRNYNIEPKILKIIFPEKQNIAKLVIVEGVKSKKPELNILKPLIIYKSVSSYTDNILKIINNRQIAL